LKVIRQGIVLWAQLTQDALGVLIDVLEPDWGMPAGVETVERSLRPYRPRIRSPWSRSSRADTGTGWARRRSAALSAVAW
jgi:hypothetical protein